MGPVSLDRPQRDAGCSATSADESPEKKLQDHDLRGAFIDDFESREGRLERQQIFDRHRAGRGGRSDKSSRTRVCAPPPRFCAFLMAAVIDEQPAHRLRRQREPGYGPASPIRVRFESEPRFVDESGLL